MVEAGAKFLTGLAVSVYQIQKTQSFCFKWLFVTHSFQKQGGEGRLGAGESAVWNLGRIRGKVLCETPSRSTWALNHSALCRFCQIFKISLWARNSWMILLGTSEWVCWWGEISLRILLQPWQLGLLNVPFLPLRRTQEPPSPCPTLALGLYFTLGQRSPVPLLCHG